MNIIKSHKHIRKQLIYTYMYIIYIYMKLEQFNYYTLCKEITTINHNKKNPFLTQYGISLFFISLWIFATLSILLYTPIYLSIRLKQTLLVYR